MKLNLLGCFHTLSGKLLVSDPCYEEVESGSNKTLKVKPGSYDCYSLTGSLKDPVMGWDKIPGNVRNAEVLIVHQDYKGKLSFRKSGSVSVDSGQCGIFKLETYRKDKDREQSLKHEKYQMIKEEISSNLSNKKFLEVYLDLSSEESKKEWKHAKDVFKTKEKWVSFNQSRLDRAVKNINKLNTHLEKGTTPSHYAGISWEKTSEFYEIMCDLSSGPYCGDVDEEYGVNASSGMGDGGFDVFVAKDNKNTIVAVYVSFIDIEEIKLK